MKLGLLNLITFLIAFDHCFCEFVCFFFVIRIFFPFSNIIIINRSYDIFV